MWQTTGARRPLCAEKMRIKVHHWDTAQQFFIHFILTYLGDIAT
jgi:hypothetical protein